MGGGAFCFKVCDPAGTNAANFCQHIYDRIGCEYNAPNNAQNDVFESCQGDNQDYPGVYTDNGQVMTYTQPAESLGPIESMPYQPRVPASSNCQTFSHNELYVAATTALGSGTAVTPAPGGKDGKHGSGPTGTRTGAPSHTGGAAHRHVPRGASIASVVGAMAFLV
jgi:hypothetical protein